MYISSFNDFYTYKETFRLEINPASAEFGTKGEVVFIGYR